MNGTPQQHAMLDALRESAAFCDQTLRGKHPPLRYQYALLLNAVDSAARVLPECEETTTLRSYVSQMRAIVEDDQRFEAVTA